MQELNPTERSKRAVKKLLLFLGLAIASILIPVAHFVLVPLFLILAFVFAWLEYQKKYFIGAQQVACQKCDKEFAMTGYFSQSSVRVYCTHCGAQASLDLTSF